MGKKHTKTGCNHALVYSSVIFEVIAKKAHIKKLLFVSIKKNIHNENTEKVRSVMCILMKLT